MFREIAQHRRFTAPRRVAVALLALILNATLVPCTMALEAVDDGHDCCPPEIRLDASECCVVDDVTHEARGKRLWLDDDGRGEILVVPVLVDALVLAPVSDPKMNEPPDPYVRAVPIHKLNCVYLN